MHAASHAKNPTPGTNERREPRTATRRTKGSEFWCPPALLGDLGALGVMRSVNTPTDSHAKNAKVAKNCNEKRVQNLMFAGLLARLA
jgi:hypothetical protein